MPQAKEIARLEHEMETEHPKQIVDWAHVQQRVHGAAPVHHHEGRRGDLMRRDSSNACPAFDVALVDGKLVIVWLDDQLGDTEHQAS